MKPSLALIINTFDQPDYLKKVFRAVGQQTVIPSEVILADDGSDERTRNLFEDWSQSLSLTARHIWQKHEGFQRARILNRAIESAVSDYLVFLDGDTLPHPRFIEDHEKVRKEQCFVQGHRCLIEEGAYENFGQGRLLSDFLDALKRRQVKSLKNGFRWPASWISYRTDLRGIRGCNLAMWKRDLVAVNGYNEAFVGWGREDSELAVRLMNRAVRRLDVRGRCVCYHLWHPPASRSNLNSNDDLLAHGIVEKSTWCEAGLVRNGRNGG